MLVDTNINFDAIVSKVYISKIIKRHACKFSDRTILLDTCAGKGIFKNADLFSNIVHSRKPILVDGVNSKTQSLFIDREGDTNFGRVYYDERAVGNVLENAERNIIYCLMIIIVMHSRCKSIAQMLYILLCVIQYTIYIFVMLI